MHQNDMRGRGPIAVEDMKRRVAAGWTVDQLWTRMQRAESGVGYTYEYFDAALDEVADDAVPLAR